VTPVTTRPVMECRRPRPQAQVRLVCFPHSGGGPTSFRDWEDAFGGRVEIWRALMPGRGQRSAEPLARDWGPLVAELAQGIAAAVPPPFAFFGHSLGAAVAFEVARALAADGLEPVHLLVSARAAPDIASALPVPPDDSDLLRRVEQVYGGVPEAIRSSPELLRYFMVIIRADLELSASYRFRPGPALRVPVTALGGDNDPAVPAADLARWAAHTDGSCQLHLLPGGHFYLDDNEEALVGIAQRALARTRRP
jgi:medium-chain acyl-[acyl-carrier-protein] hydrolase